jgi:signal transduction histidine kinase
MTVAERTAALVELLPRPLDPVRSVKLKISILLLASGGVGLAYLWFEFRWQPPIPISLVTVALVLLTAQVLGHGMTRPLRAMTAAARAMAQGDYSRRVRATSRDEIGELAVAFNQMAADLAAADGRRRELIANVSHELRTPVAALQAVLENLVDGVAEPDAATLSTALGQTERLGRLVAELLDLSRIDAGAVPPDLADVPVAELIAQTIAEAETAARAGGRDVTVQADVRPPGMTVHADRGRLHQVLLNLLDNAARHGPPGGAVRVTARTEGDLLVIEVSDDGPGIDPADRERVFHRFTRGERAVGGGTGLGLAIARWAVDLHGGQIAVVEPSSAGVAVDGVVVDGAAVDGVSGAGVSGCRIRVTLPGAS